MAAATVGDVVGALEACYPPALAEPWDAVGLVCGDPSAPVRRVLLAIDPVPAVAAEAVAAGVDLLVTHHPLFLDPVHGVAATSTRGRLVHDLVRSGIALHVAHTNADVSTAGVSDALAALLGLPASDTAPLDPRDPPGGGLDKVVTYLPADAVDRVVDAMTAAGAGTIGGYTRCAFTGEGSGTFLGGPGTAPVVGRSGTVERVAESRLEMRAPRALRGPVVRALLAAHPYEEPAFDVYPIASISQGVGMGRIGPLATSTTLAEFLRLVAARLPATAAGVRAAGRPRTPVRTVAVCGGSGGDLAAAAGAAGADVLVTADLRHHRARGVVDDGGPALVDPGHWASERPWLPVAAARLSAMLRSAGTTVDVTVSELVTDPWTGHAAQPASETGTGREESGQPT